MIAFLIHDKIPNGIKNLINRRKRLLKIEKINKTTLNLPSIKLLSREISNYFSRQRIGNVKRAATGPNGNLWRAVKRAKNIVQDKIPSNSTLGENMLLLVILPIVMPSTLVAK